MKDLFIKKEKKEESSGFLFVKKGAPILKLPYSSCLLTLQRPPSPRLFSNKVTEIFLWDFNKCAKKHPLTPPPTIAKRIIFKILLSNAEAKYDFLSSNLGDEG